MQVSPLSVQETEAFFLEFKAVLMGFLPLALGSLTPETLQRLRAIARTLDQEGLASDEHLTFWRLIFDPCGMPRLSRTVEQLIWRCGRYFAHGGKAVLTQCRDLRPDRMDFLDACAAGDADRAIRNFLAFLEVRKAAFQQSLRETLA